MKKLWIFYIALCAVGWVCADTTIDPSHPYAYGANIGWLTARADGTNGAVIGQAYCSGCLYGANVGWICLGNGNPDNRVAYGNDSATDYGVNHDGQGNLTGYAWGANIGWLAFEQTYGQPRVDLRTGALSGQVWGANIGWISLSNAQAYARTATLDAGADDDADGIPDAWEYAHTNAPAALNAGAADADGDGMTDSEEYAADTDPFDDGDNLRITSLSVTAGTNTLEWTARPTRLYRVEVTNALAGVPAAWPDAGPGILGPPVGGAMQQAIATGDSAATQFYRVRAVLPLEE